MKLAIELNIPDGAVDKNGEAELVRSVKEQAVLKLYAADRVTIGEAAEMLDCTRVDFLHLLTTSGVGYHADLDQKDFEQIGRVQLNICQKAQGTAFVPVS